MLLVEFDSTGELYFIANFGRTFKGRQYIVTHHFIDLGRYIVQVGCTGKLVDTDEARCVAQSIAENIFGSYLDNAAAGCIWLNEYVVLIYRSDNTLPFYHKKLNVTYTNSMRVGFKCLAGISAQHIQ